jgi:hypothetical protein
MFTYTPKIDIINIINIIIKPTRKFIKNPNENNKHITDSIGTELFPSRPGILQTNRRISNGTPDIINTGRNITWNIWSTHKYTPS